MCGSFVAHEFSSIESKFLIRSHASLIDRSLHDLPRVLDLFFESVSNSFEDDSEILRSIFKETYRSMLQFWCVESYRRASKSVRSGSINRGSLTNPRGDPRQRGTARSGMETKTDEPRTGDLDENPLDWMICKSGARRIVAESLLSCVRYCANQVPKRMTLDRLRILAALLVILMPRPLTYILLYPIFRLVFGNLYPAYASYKAVRTKNVKEYVSIPSMLKRTHAEKSTDIPFH